MVYGFMQQKEVMNDNDTRHASSSLITIFSFS